MTEAYEGNGFDVDPRFSNSDDFSTPYQSQHKLDDTGIIRRSTGPEPSLAQSPESFENSSSSGSSYAQHKRNGSAESFRSGPVFDSLDIHGLGYSPGFQAPDVAISPMEGPVTQDRSPTPDIDASNREMESHFDFNTAASSPVMSSQSIPDLKSSRPRMVPHRPVQRTGISNGAGPIFKRSKGSGETAPMPSMIKGNPNRSSAVAEPIHPLLRTSGDFFKGVMLQKRSEESKWPTYLPSKDPKSSSPETRNIPQQPSTAMPFASPEPVAKPFQRPTLEISELRPKSRVESQLYVTLRLWPMPQGVTKVHLQRYHMAKSSLIVRPPPKKRPEMLELYAEVVCTSAMGDEANRAHAFARAAGPQPTISRNRPASLGDSPSPDKGLDKDWDEPINGGAIHICEVCMERENKRHLRKKVKNNEEEQEWQTDKTKRTIMFNTQEVRDWTSPIRQINEEGNPQRFQYPDTAGEVELPMRIACYCRHHDKPGSRGFQVIFTLKDHQDSVVTQAISSSIMITDDHKNQASPGAIPIPSAVFPDVALALGSHVFAQAPYENQGSARFRHSYSTNDIAGLQRDFHAQHNTPLILPQNTSQTTSATLTPSNFSRPASPSMRLEQPHKKRKASSCGRVRPGDLAMTKLQTSSGPTLPMRGVSHVGDYASHGLGEASRSPPNYVPPNGLPMQQVPLQYNTNPPSPSTADRAFFSWTQPSQGMESLQGFAGVPSTPHSMNPSRVPSPASGMQSNSMQHINAQMISTSLHSASRAVQAPKPYQISVINKVTPAEGSISGGMEVTFLGSGFRQGLEIMFGDSKATTTTYWGEHAICCLAPPASQAGVVPVTFKHDYNLIAVPPPNKLVVFRYVDDEEQELMKHALALINRQWNGSATDAGESARNIIKVLGANASFMGGLPQGSVHQGSSNQRAVTQSEADAAETMDFETAILNCLNLVDLDDSPHQANFNAQGGNGQSMLHLSASLGYYRLTAGLLARGANPDIRDGNGLSPMHVASLRGHPKTIRKLRSAGADPTLRTLNGFTPADMAISEQTYDASNAFDHFTRSRSAAATPTSYLSRASSVRSSRSSRGAQMRPVPAVIRSGTFGDEESVDEILGGPCRSRPVSPVQIFARSRRNSLEPQREDCNDESPDEVSPYASMFATNPALGIWRDQLATQIHQLQQSMQRTLPNFPIPNIPDYQANAVIRRISQLVPQRTSRPSIVIGSSASAKENDQHWWERLTRPTSSPPAYDEIYPENSEGDMVGKETLFAHAVGEALLNQKPETNVLQAKNAQNDVGDKEQLFAGAVRETFLDQKFKAHHDQAESSSPMATVDLGNSSLTNSEREELRKAHAKRMKRLRSDRKLFLIWLPLLILLVGAMMKDRIPQAYGRARVTYGNVKERFQAGVAEAV